LSESDVGVGVKAEDFRVVLKGKGTNQLFDLGEADIGGRVVDPRGGEVELAIHDLGIKVLAEEGLDEAHIFVVSDSSAVVDFSDDDVKREVGHLRLFVEVHLEKN